MYVPHHACNHSSKNFKNSDLFIPERWIGGPEFAQDNKVAFQPFSVGPRNCIGKSMAYHEMRLLFALVLWHFDLELDDKQLKWMQQPVFTLWEKPPLMIRMTPVRRE